MQLLVTGVQQTANAGLKTGDVIPSFFGVQGEIGLTFSQGLLALEVDAAPVAFEGIRDILVNLSQRVKYFKKSELMNMINLQF